MVKSLIAFMNSKNSESTAIENPSLVPDHFGSTPLHTACTFGNLDLLQLLLKTESRKSIEYMIHPSGKNSETCEFESPYHLAASNGHALILKALIDYVSFFFSLFFLRAIGVTIRKIKILGSRKSKHSWLSWHLASCWTLEKGTAGQESHECLDWETPQVFKSYPRVLYFLLLLLWAFLFRLYRFFFRTRAFFFLTPAQDKELYVTNSTVGRGKGTPLHMACRRGHKAVVEVLTNDFKFDVNVKDALETSPTLLASRCM